MKAHDIRALMSAPPEWVSEDGLASFWIPERFNQGALWAGSFQGQSPWERQPDGDQLIYVLEGEVEVTVLTDDETVRTVVKAGSAFVVPRGLWHRQSASEIAVQFGVTTGVVKHSTEEDPRLALAQ